MTWTVEDAALMLQAIAGPDPRDPTSSAEPVSNYVDALREDLSGTVIGVARHFFFADEPDVDVEVLGNVDRALEALRDLGAEVREVSIPSLAYARAASSVIMLSEAFAYHEKNLKERPQDYGPVRDQFLMGALYTAADYVQAQRVRALLQEEIAATLQGVDVLVMPSFPVTAPAFEGYDPAAVGRGFRFLGPLRLHVRESAGGDADRR